MGVAIGCIKDA